jgi:hypothetical protein
MPIARPRSRSAGRRLVRIYRVQGIRAAAPTPITTRPAVSDPALPAKAE